jgi:hypothetical protein
MADLERALINADKAGDTQAAEILATEIKRQRGANQSSARLAVPPQLGGPLGVDVAMGARQVWDAAAQMAARGAESIGDKFGGSPMLTRMREDTEAANKAALEDYQKRFGGRNDIGPSLARGVGQAIVTAPAFPAIGGAGALRAIAGGAGSGAASGAMTPVYDIPEGQTFWDAKLDQAKQGAMAGGALGGAGVMAGKFVSPKLRESARELLDKDVRLTPGQSFGGAADWFEQHAMKFPFVGGAVNAARKQSIEDFNRVLYGKALAPWGADGASVAKSAKVGREGISEVSDFIAGKYESALGRSVPAPVDVPFRAATAKIRKMVPRPLRDEFDDIVKQAIEITPAKTITPTALKQADSAIGSKAAGFRGSQEQNYRDLGRALGQMKMELRELMARHNPMTAAELRAADEGYRTLVQIERAGALLGSKDGVITPAAFVNAVKAGDSSLRKNAFSKGDAYNQAFAENAKRVLPATVGDSGTPGGLAALGALANPLTAVKTIGAAAPMLAMYAPGSSAAFRALMTQRPAIADPISALMRQEAPYLGLLASGLLSGSQ